ncbi:MAG: N-acetylglucosaminyltransferase, beta-1,4-mannosyl-glycoprotein beta-1,4-N-acetylglucosaminyltransferase [Candidatus Peregrinibacteria bacterium GW2011_GWC2_33_13]|nr:MAG: N-acetylglucosaminyltransferase, beta-1,4-mannosyl-glycoprotein beta-1,4-N-acetylglucosaminyltransferase [Candidatus Peregrinibacteria bacterium GW2011_GWC2_33_13]
MIYDCFIFFNELDLLEIRLNTLNDVVDRFVLVEATKTHSNKPKPLHFKKNKARFSKFLHKIEHIIVDDYPPYEDSWTFENHQRNCIERGLKNCQPDDIIIISDCDEIPNPKTIIENKDVAGIKVLEQNLYYYYFNYICENQTKWLLGTRMLTYKDFLHGLDDVVFSDEAYLKKNINYGTTATKIRFAQGLILENGGWHFSYLGGAKKISEKIKAFSHQEFNNRKNSNIKNIEKAIVNGNDIFGRDYKFKVIELDNTFPEYILNNQGKYSHLIFSPENIIKKQNNPYLFFLK